MFFYRQNDYFYRYNDFLLILNILPLFGQHLHFFIIFASSKTMIVILK